MMIEGVALRPEPVDADSEMGWKEKEENGVSSRYQDAFGDETNAQVKYKTMEWW